ncbi:S-adenosyl-L-methionine-dependent methyltransferase [Xylaria acuta]|nr:S-adenosyl-L-methionine-dependent methyltransferase [Xylaria acuta]
MNRCSKPLRSSPCHISMYARTQITDEGKGLGFSIRYGVDWYKYMLYRPTYRESFFRRIYEYHTQKPEASWSTAHDVGAGHGIVSATLANRFNQVVVSDPNAGYNKVARQLLVEQYGWPESKFVFLQEGAEESSVETETVDLITACECMQWTNTDDAVDEFARQLKPGGTPVMTLYMRPLILGNERAQAIWKEIWGVFSKKTNTGHLFERAFQISNSGYDSIAVPSARWEAIKRVYINSSQGIASFKISDDVGEDRVGSNEDRVWVHGDPDWSDEQDVDWLKKYFATWGPAVPESEIRDLWDELERITNGAKVRMETPLVMVFATKRT